MAVDDPEPGFPSAGCRWGCRARCRASATTDPQWKDPDKTAFQTALQALVNRTPPVVDDPTGPDPQVVPPIYGRWHAGVVSVSPSGTGWLDELNLDPRNRTAGGTRHPGRAGAT